MCSIGGAKGGSLGVIITKRGLLLGGALIALAIVLAFFGPPGLFFALPPTAAGGVKTGGVTLEGHAVGGLLEQELYDVVAGG